MSRGVSKFLLGLAIFAWLSYKIFPKSFDFLFYDTCSVAYAQVRVDEMLSDGGRENYKKQKAREEMDRAFSKFNLSPQQEIEAKRDGLIYVWFINNKQCPMPEEVEDAFFKWDKGEDGDNSGNKNCPADFYLEEGQAFLLKLKDMPEEYSDLQKKAYSMLAGSVDGDKKTLEQISRRWSEEEFRDNFILAVLQTSKRTEAECKDPGLPMNRVVKDFLQGLVSE